MAKQLIGRGQVTLTDITDSKYLTSYIGSTTSTTVVHNPNTGMFTPDFSDNPSELYAELYFAGDTTNRISDASDIKWFKQSNSVGELKEITGSMREFSVNRDKLTIRENILEDLYSMTFQAHITYPIEVETDVFEDLIIITDIQFTRVENGAEGKPGDPGAPGEDAIVAILTTPEGTAIRNHEGSLTAVLTIYKGTNVVTPSVIRWYKLSPYGEGDAYSGSGWERMAETSNTLTLEADDIQSTGVFMVIPTFEGEEYRATVTLMDFVDEVTGNIIGATVTKNGRESVTLTHKLYRAGEEIDVNDNQFTHHWTSYHTDGTQDTSFSKTGKTITVHADEIVDIREVQCYFESI